LKEQRRSTGVTIVRKVITPEKLEGRTQERLQNAFDRHMVIFYHC